jgi:hypothetical protein
MIIYNNSISFKVLDQEITLISDDSSYGRVTFAEVDNKFIYLGNVNPDIQTAISLWEKINKRSLLKEEIIDVTIEGYSDLMKNNSLEDLEILLDIKEVKKKRKYTKSKSSKEIKNISTRKPRIKKSNVIDPENK